MISVLMPSRGRPEQLVDSIDSLLDMAVAPAGVEILVALDPDDEASATAMLQYEKETAAAWVAPKRYGYSGLHQYVNFLAGQATGEWLMLWNDDSVMETEGWDEIIEAMDNRYVLWPYVNHDQGGNLFPIWPQFWYEVLGYASMSPNIDVWVSEIARRLGVEVNVPVKIQHDRPDIVGTEPDETHLQGRALMGTGNHPAYDSPANRVERSRAVRVLTQVYRWKQEG